MRNRKITSLFELSQSESIMIYYFVVIINVHNQFFFFLETVNGSFSLVKKMKDHVRKEELWLVA